MGYADDLVHVAITWSAEGTSDWSPEIAMITWKLKPHIVTVETPSWSEMLNPLPGLLKGKFDDHLSGIGSWWSSRAAITQIKCTHMDNAGHALDVATLEVIDDSLRGEGSTNMLPPEVALVVSQFGYAGGTFTTHKGRKRGRFYLPYLPSALLAADGKVGSSNLAVLADAWQSFINDVQGMHIDHSCTIDCNYWDWVVASKVDASWENVEAIAVDNHFDVQRRRQHQSPAVREDRVISHS